MIVKYMHNVENRKGEKNSAVFITCACSVFLGAPPQTANKPINAHVLHRELSCTRIIISCDSTKYEDDNINQYSNNANICNGCVPPNIDISDK